MFEITNPLVYNKLTPAIILQYFNAESDFGIDNGIAINKLSHTQETLSWKKLGASKCVQRLDMKSPTKFR